MGPAEDLRGTAVVTGGGSARLDLAAGLADVEADVPCAPGTRFQLCSVSKQFVAAAAMLLVESGRVDMHDPVDRWLGQGHPQWRQVTLHHLLSHTAGIPHWLEAPGLDPAEPVSISERLEIIQATSLRGRPGAQWHYSSPGFLLAASIVERASGQPYPEFLAERIMSPLELTQTTMGGVPPGAARGYNDGQPVAPWNLDVMPGTGDIWSTAGDLTRFTVALHSGELIAASSLRAMRTAHATLSDDDDGEPRLVTTGYGYGIFTGTFAGHTAYYHPGDNPGHQSIACWIPDRAASIVILANDEAASITGLLRQLLPAALGTEATKPGPTSHGRETASPTNP
jgi:CubicO group peptidase (beta-lactamase class C family)